MTPLEAVLVGLAGVGAGAINAVVGSGTLITFPTLLAIGLPPVVANVSNTVGLVPGSVAGAWGYRRELAGQRSRVVRLASATIIGAIIGAVLLLVLPESSFEAVVPALILLGCVLVVIQPWVTQRLGERTKSHHGGPWVWLGVLAIGIYGGYTGPEAAQQAVNALRAAGAADRDIVVMSSEPFEEYEFSHRDKATWLHWIAGAGGVTGLLTGYLLTTTTQQLWPLRTSGMAEGGLANMTSTRPPARSTSAGGAPL